MRHAFTGCVLMALSVFALGASAAELTDIRVWSGPDQTRVVFDLDKSVQHEIQMLENPRRVVIDIHNAWKTPSMASKRPGKGVVQSVRTGVQPGGVLRVVLDVSADVEPHAFDLAPNGDYGHRLVVDLDDPSAQSDEDLFALLTGPLPPSGPESVPPPTAPAKPSKPSVAAATAPSRSTPPASTPRATSSPALRPIIVAVDAGHGGEDTGARGPSGVREKDVALSMARRLAKMINKEPGMKAVLIRDGDYYIGLRQRTAKARKAQADLFISIHADACRRCDGARGSSVYVVSQRGASSEQARALAERENASDLVGGVRLTGRNDRDAFLLSVLQDTSMEASFDVANRLLNELGRLNHLHKESVQQAGFMVLKSPDIPSVLVETAFISNRHEESKLDDDDYQDDIARALMSGVRNYFGNYRPGRTVAAADPNDG